MKPDGMIMVDDRRGRGMVMVNGEMVIAGEVTFDVEAIFSRHFCN
jgi:hypothetical protein